MQLRLMAAVETREAEGDGAAKVLADDLYDDASDIHATSEKSQKLTKGDCALTYTRFGPIPPEMLYGR
jgi:hypothetical protein